MKYLIGFILLLVTTFAYAGNAIDSAGLSAAQIAQLQAEAAKMAQQNSPAGTATQVAEFATTWGKQAATAAEGFATALGIAAKQLNISVNDFLHTDAGKLTAALIIWKVAGASIITLFWCIILWITAAIMVRLFYMRLFTSRYEKITYSKFGDLFKGERMVRVPKSFKDLQNDGEWLVLWIIIGIIGLTVLITGLVL